MKKCNGCQLKKEFSEFHKQSENVDGYRSTCKFCGKSVLKKYYNSNKDEIITYEKEFYKLNSNSVKKRTKQYKANKIATNIGFKLSTSLRSRLYMAIKNNQKVGSAVKDLGCSVEEFKRHMESKWQPGMSWENWSRYGWHIDHIIPLCKFDLTNLEQFKKACHYTNLQPMWAKENLVKGGR